MTIDITSDDVTAAVAAYSGADAWIKTLPISIVGMRAALESFVARHPELAPQRAMHEPVDPRVEKLAAILRDAGMDADKAQTAAARATAELMAELDEVKA